MFIDVVGGECEIIPVTKHEGLSYVVTVGIRISAVGEPWHISLKGPMLTPLEITFHNLACAMMEYNRWHRNQLRLQLLKKGVENG